jgi:inner membrane protein
LSAVQPWYWWALGVILAIVEVLAPGFVFLWLGVSALLTGSILWLWPDLDWQAQMSAFAALAVGSVLGWFAWRRRSPASSSDKRLNRRAAQQIGALGSLVDGIRDGRGRMRLGDTTWLVAGPDLPAGTRVRVVGAAGSRLRVEPVDTG